jgi:type IV secretion system protein VirD4
MSTPPPIIQQVTSKPFFDGFLRGVPGEGIGQASAASFESVHNVVNTPSLQFNLPNHEGKIFLGVMDGQVNAHRLQDGRKERFLRGGVPIGLADDRHVITVAGSRAGKGRGVIIPNLLSYPGSVLAIDPKGDLAAETARFRREQLGQSVYAIDPFGVSQLDSSYQATYNPLQTLNRFSETLVEDAGLIADALIVPSDHSDPHWNDSAKTFVEGIILHVVTGSAYEGRRNLGTVYDLLMKADEALRLEMLNNPAASGAVVDAAVDFFERADKERLSVLSSARQQLKFLSYSQIRKVLVDGDFELGEMKRKPVTIFLSLPAMRMGTCSRLLRLFVNMTLAAMEAEQVKPRYPVLMCLDEFAVLGPMKTIENAAGQIAGLGVKLWPILQDLGQLKSLYKDRWETFMGNAGVLQFFGNSDLETLTWISKRLGNTTVLTQSHSQVGREASERQGATGDSWGQSTQEILTIEEASRLFGRDDHLLRQLIIRPSFPPMILQRAFHDKHELFEGKADRR